MKVYELMSLLGKAEANKEVRVCTLQELMSGKQIDKDCFCLSLGSDDFEWLEKAKEALGKQIPKKPVKTKSEIVCPTCNTFLGSSPYCRYCGQAIDWSDTE